MTMSNSNRHPGGTSVGGQWAPGSATEVELDDVFEADEDLPLRDLGADDESAGGHPVVFAKAGRPVEGLEPGQLAVISDGDYYAVATSRGIVVAKNEGDGLRVSEYVRSEQSFPGAFADPSSEIADLCREGPAVNKTWDSSVDLAEPQTRRDLQGADYETIRNELAASASGYLGATSSDQTEADAYRQSGFGPGRLDDDEDFDAAVEFLDEHPTLHPMPPKGQEGSNRAVEGIKGVVRPGDVDRVFAYKSEGSHEFYYGISNGSVWTRRTR